MKIKILKSGKWAVGGTDVREFSEGQVVSLGERDAKELIAAGRAAEDKPKPEEKSEEEDKGEEADKDEGEGKDEQPSKAERKGRK